MAKTGVGGYFRISTSWHAVYIQAILCTLLSSLPWLLHSCKVCPFTALFTTPYHSCVATWWKYKIRVIRACMQPTTQIPCAAVASLLWLEIILCDRVFLITTLPYTTSLSESLKSYLYKYKKATKNWRSGDPFPTSYIFNSRVSVKKACIDASWLL